MKHGVDDSLIYLTADIQIQNNPNTINASWHEVKSFDVIEKNATQNDRSLRNVRKLNTETSYTSTTLILWFVVLHISPLKIKSINIVTLSPHVLSIRLI